MSTVTPSDLFNVDPYYDDYTDSKKFLRILSRPGYALQAREVTQVQSILQKQIQRFGDNIFKDGSIVTESQVFLNPVKYVRVGGLTGYSGVSIGDFDGLTAVVSGKNTIKVLDTLSSLSGSTKDTQSILVFSDYLNGATGFAVGDTLSANLNGTTIYASVTGASANDDYSLSIPPAFGSASLIGLESGVRYIKGFFVNHDSQKITPYNTTGSSPNTYRKFNSLNSTIKLDVTDTIVTATDDTSLNDPAFGSYNYGAPGADRYRIDLNLAHGPLSATGDYTLINIEAGEATYKVNYPEYNVLADTLARRTYDESGNYTLDDFPISIADHATDESQLTVNIGKGKAYIFGYEFINFNNKSIDISKPRTTTSISTNVAFPLGSEVDIQFNSLTSSGIPSVLTNINFNSGPVFFLSSGTGGTFNNIGTVRIGKFSPYASPYTANLYDINLTSGYTITDAKRLFLNGYTGNNQHLFEFVSNPVVVRNSSYGHLLFPLSNDVTSFATKSVNSLSNFEIHKSCTKTLSGTNTTFSADSDFGFPSGDDWYTFTSASDFKVFSITGAAITGSSSLTGSAGTQMYFTSAATGTVVAFASFNVSYDSTTSIGKFWREKTLTTTTATVQMRSNAYEEYAYLNGAVDVYSIISVTGQFGSGSQTAMTSYFDLDTGQKDHIYDWSRITVKKDYLGRGITGVSVTFKKFSRSGTNTEGPFIAQSYTDFIGAGISASEFKNVPIYSFQSQNGKIVSLAGCVDYRPDRATPGSFTGSDISTNYGATGSRSFVNYPSGLVAWTYYLPRTDKIVLSRDKQFKIIPGIATEQAPAPGDRDDAMTLGTIFLPPYTKSSTDPTQFIVKNRRYTMKDVGAIDKRVGRLEYYTTLTLAEKEAKDLEIQDANGLNKFKNGIFVDNFTSHSNSQYTNTDHQISVDPLKKEIRPKFDIRYVDFSLTGSVGTGLTMSSDGLISLAYTTEVLISQPLASKAVNVNPFNVSNFNGSLTLNPTSDDWIDTTKRPDVTVNLEGENDGLADGVTVDFGTVWNNWENNWVGTPQALTTWRTTSITRPQTVLTRNGWAIRTEQERFAIQDTSQVRTGQKILVNPETVSRSIGDRIVDIGIVPFMRANTITISAKGMRPYVRVYPFFDNVDVSAYVSVNGVAGAAITTDEQGRIGVASTVLFNLPASVFRTGERVFRLIDSTSNVVASATTTADQVYRAQGIIKTEENTIISTRSLNIRRQAVTDERVFGNIITEKVAIYTDPVAQTFYVDPISYPYGMFLKKVSLYFKNKSSTLPVYIQIRPTVNGYPSSSAIIPFTEVYKSPSEVNISDDAGTATDFEFTSPVYLQPGEYAITVLSNSDDYYIWVSEVGQTEISTGNVISAQPYAGSFFKSQNSSTWTAEQAMDLKFVLHKCLFTYDGTNNKASFGWTETNLSTGLTGIDNGANVFKLNATYITPPTTYVTPKVEFGPGAFGTEISVQNLENYVFASKKYIIDGNTNQIKSNFYFDTTLSSPLDVSPILDTQRVSGLYIQNLVRTVSDVYKDPIETLATIRGVTGSNFALARYLSKKINLQQGFESTNVDVYFSARKPKNSDIRVYLKSQIPTDNTSFDNLPYEAMTLDSSYQKKSDAYVSVGEDDYVDLHFARGATATNYSSGITGQSEFKSFQVKVVIYGDPTNSVTPAVKELKVIAS